MPNRHMLNACSKRPRKDIHKYTCPFNDLEILQPSRLLLAFHDIGKDLL